MDEGKRLSIVTIVDEPYFGFIPLFQHCVEKVYPKAACLVFTRGDSGYPGTLKIDSDPFTKSHYTTAALRFLMANRDMLNSDYTLITDVDILFKPEKIPLVDQHLNHMKANGLTCYSNSDHGDHMSGVHFVTQEWWTATCEARFKYLKELETREVGLGEDEQILWNVVTESNLSKVRNTMLWNVHGLHLGRFRNKSIKAVRFKPDEAVFIGSLLADEVFMQLLDDSCEKCPTLRNEWTTLMAIYTGRYK